MASTIAAPRVDPRRTGLGLACAARWAAAAWLACALAFVLARPLGLWPALAVHAALLPLAFFAATVLAWSRPSHPGALAAAALAACVAMGFAAAASLVAGAPAPWAVQDAPAPTVLLRPPVAVAPAHGAPEMPRRPAREHFAWAPTVLGAAGTLAAGLLLSCSGCRRRFLAWTASVVEQREALPGDGAVRDADLEMTEAITIAAPPGAVWRLVSQLGRGAGGWLGFDSAPATADEAADQAANGPATSAPRPGERLAFAGCGAVWLEVLEVVRGRHLVLGAHLADGPVHSLPWREAPPARVFRASWAFVLAAAPGIGTRLLVRLRLRARPRLTWTGGGALFPLGHLLAQRAQLLELRRRAEAQRDGWQADADGVMNGPCPPP